MKQIFIFGAAVLCVLEASSLRGQNPPSEAASSTTPALATKSYPAEKTKLLLDSRFKDPQTSLESSGVTFPAGSFAHWESKPKRLVVCNTKENLDLVDALLVPQSASPEWLEATRRVYAAAPPKLSITRAFALVQRSHQKMFATYRRYRRAVFLSSVRLVLVADPQASQPASTPFWEIKYSWNYRPEDEAEIYYVTMDGKLTSEIVRH